jgi:guanylate cyclase
MFIVLLEITVSIILFSLESLESMANSGFYINDLCMHNLSRDMVLVGSQRSADLKNSLELEKHKSKSLEENMKKLDDEMKKADQLLYQMIPKKIADRVRDGGSVINTCEVFNQMFITIKMTLFHLMQIILKGFSIMHNFI